jgi:hypothetical protein
MTTRPPQTVRYLTPKRREFLANFRTHPVIAIDGIYRLLDTKNETQERAARRFARDLATAGYLLRKKAWNSDEAEYEGTPHWHYVYRLSKYGATVVNGRDASEQSSSSVEHDEAVTDFMLTLQANYPRDLYVIPGDLKRTVNPDKAFGLPSVVSEKWFYFFLEVERQRQSLSRTNHKGLIERLMKYDAYRKTDTCRKEWKLFSDFRVIVVVPNEELRQHFLERLSTRITGTWVWVTTQRAYKEDVLGDIFKTPADSADRPRSLREI